MTDSPQYRDATPEGTTPEGVPKADIDERTGAAPAEDAGEAVAEDAVPTDDAGAHASSAATAAADAAKTDDDDHADVGDAKVPGTSEGEGATDEREAEVSGRDGSDAVTEGEGGHEVLDLDVLADADPRSKAELLGELVVAEHKRDEYLDDLRRSHADFENYRRRILREGAVQRDAGKADIAGPLLEVIDDLDRTLVAADGSSDKDLAKGVALVASKLTTTLSRVGLERIEATGVPFDPNVHEAVQQQPADEPAEEPVVVQVLRPGYRLGERTLRPAMVVVEQ